MTGLVEIAKLETCCKLWCEKASRIYDNIAKKKKKNRRLWCQATPRTAAVHLDAP